MNTKYSLSNHIFYCINKTYNKTCIAPKFAGNLQETITGKRRGNVKLRIAGETDF